MCNGCFKKFYSFFFREFLHFRVCFSAGASAYSMYFLKCYFYKVAHRQKKKKYICNMSYK